MELRNGHLSRLMYKMKVSGYSKHQRLEVLVSGLKGYKRMKKDEQEGRRLINRPEWVGNRARRIKKLVGKKTWYKSPLKK